MTTSSRVLLDDILPVSEGSNVRPPLMQYVQAVVVVFNLIMGSGILAVPHAFFLAGWALGIIVLCVMGFFAYCSIVWLFECQLRAQALNAAFVAGCIRVVPFGVSNAQGAAYTPMVPEDTEAASIAQTSQMGPGLKAEPRTGGASGEATPVRSRAGSHYGSEGASNNINVVYDPNTAGSSKADELSLVPPFVAAASAQMALSPFGLYDVEAVGTPEEIAAAVDYDVLNADFEYLEQDHVAAVCGGRPAAITANLSQVLFQNAGNWVYMVVLSEVAVLLIPLPGYTSFLECNMHEPTIFDSKPHCTHAMRIFIALWTVFFLASMVRNWKVIDYFQRLATTITYVALIIMVISCCVGMSQTPFAPALSDQTIQSVPAFDFGKFSDLFGVVAFCLVCHPGSALMLRRMPRRRDSIYVYLVAFMLIMVLYCVVSIVVAFYMGPNVSHVMNMSWIDFGKTWGKKDSTPLRVLGIIVVGFPLFSVSACYILYLRALAESMEAFVPTAFHIKFASLFGETYRGPAYSLYPVSHFMRFIAVAVPALLAFITFKFDKAMAVAGFFAFFLCFFAPGVMQLYSARLVRKVGIPPNPHETWLGHNAAAAVVMAFCILAAGYYVWKQMIPALS